MKHQKANANAMSKLVHLAANLFILRRHMSVPIWVCIRESICQAQDFITYGGAIDSLGHSWAESLVPEDLSQALTCGPNFMSFLPQE